MQDSTNPSTQTDEPRESEFRRLKAAVEVFAGILPGTPDPGYTKTYYLFSDEWNDTTAEGRAELLADMNGRAQGYAALLMLSPDRVNWVRTEWTWL